MGKKQTDTTEKFVTIEGQHFELLAQEEEQMSAFDRRPLCTNVRKYANFIPLFSSHWTIRTVTRT